MNKLSVVKIGGSTINSSVDLENFLADFAAIKNQKILVHGGGKLATALSRKLDLTPQLVEGRRITTEEDLEVVSMVYAGLINKQIVAGLQAKGCNAIGLSGADANLIEATKRPITSIDYGFVGDIQKVNSKFIKLLLENGLNPICNSITHNKQGQLLNTNADTIASEIAKAMSHSFEVELIYCFEENGVLAQKDKPNTVIDFIDEGKYQQLKHQGIITDGMIPKIDNCFNALRNGVRQVKIMNAHSLNKSNVQYTQIVKK